MQVLLSAERIRERVAELARAIAAYYHGQPVTVLGVLTGCLLFLADLIRQLPLSVRVVLIQASSYRGDTTTPGKLHVQSDLLPDLRGRHVLLIDDILDTGQTLSYLVEHLRGLGLASLKTAVLLRKEGRQRLPIEPDYCGFSIPDVFVVGYGLDFHDQHRQLPYLAVLPAGPESSPPPNDGMVQSMAARTGAGDRDESQPLDAG